LKKAGRLWTWTENSMSKKKTIPETRSGSTDSVVCSQILLKGKQFFFRGAGKSSRGGAAKGLPARAQRPGGEHGGEEPRQDPARN